MSVLVIAEHEHALLKGATLNTVTAATQCGGDVHVLVAGFNAADAAKHAAEIQGVAKVLHADAPQLEEQLAENVAAQVLAIAANYSHILFPATAHGKNVAPRVAALLDVAQISDITKVDAADTFERPIYAGNAIATVQSADAVKVITVRATAFDLDDALKHEQVNYVGALYLLDAVLPTLLRQRHGHLSLVSSISGYRGLPKALAYGPTKAALINLAQTLWLDLSERGIGVSVVNPGFVETPLTAQNDFKMPALLTPEQAADEILAGWAAGRFEIHFPKRFTLWVKALSHLGDASYFRAVRRATGL